MIGACASGQLRGQAAALRTVAAWNFVLAHRELPDATAAAISRVVLAAKDPVAAIHQRRRDTRRQRREERPWSRSIRAR